jgi:hypothetical protein
VNEVFLGIATFTAHRISGTIRHHEWILIFSGPALVWAGSGTVDLLE